jgi:hypothetical protein
MSKAQTPALGASIVRSEIKAKIKRMKVEFRTAQNNMISALDKLDQFIDSSAERSQARPGGLGKKKKS